ncbi:lipopolysaccharide biosynthesis protein [Duganella sp. BJB488]|uniref:oligosaccharide flippase family protein n=1 Tax=unclassified Duganella TaxID=2636909 RepID=UPI000E353E24|nr:MULTISPECIES: oligosaccharide flippase family protein [unclassified Duganella]RFP21475.1 lipopolysaccharide biosynthesis protein [Duganella sp. BJB489]RFP23760.1 lipopolysaccharide biosynthesis protein [Duganella sp. BJB488]RFP38431.1 lipopolysaccharide biosynthesis protein [Duganella sp. BJB480]
MRALPPFWKHLLTVLSGSVAAQALPILAAPLITRLCRPADLGRFGVWYGVVAIAAVAATLRMENAMIIDHAPARQRLCFGVVAWSAGWLAALLTLAATAARAAGWTTLPWSGVLTLGAAAWLTAGMQTTLAYAASHNAFAPAAKAKIWAAGGVALSQLALLAAGAGAVALPAGQLLGLATGLAAARLLLRPPSSRTRARRPLVRLRLLARRLRRGALPTPAQRRYLHAHRAFWRYALPSNVLNAAIGPLPLLLIGARHGALAAGLFALTQRVLAAPVSLLAASVQEVFKRESVRQYQNSGNCRPAWRHAARVLLLGFLPSLLLLLAAPPLFAFAFGAPWRAAGELAQILAPLYFLNFIASPLSYVFFVAGRQKIELAWQLALFAMTLAVFAAPLTLHQSVAAYATGYSLLYLVYLRMSYRYALDRDPAGRLHAAR